VIIRLGVSLDQSQQINHLAAGRGFGEGQAAERTLVVGELDHGDSRIRLAIEGVALDAERHIPWRRGRGAGTCPQQVLDLLQLALDGGLSAA
jgi:hypothetical protein